MVYSLNIKKAIIEAIQSADQPFFTRDLIPKIETLIEKPIHPKRVAYYLGEIEEEGLIVSNKNRNGGTKEYKVKMRWAAHS